MSYPKKLNIEFSCKDLVTRTSGKTVGYFIDIEEKLGRKTVKKVVYEYAAF